MTPMNVLIFATPATAFTVVGVVLFFYKPHNGYCCRGKDKHQTVNRVPPPDVGEVALLSNIYTPLELCLRSSLTVHLFSSSFLWLSGEGAGSAARAVWCPLGLGCHRCRLALGTRAAQLSKKRLRSRFRHLFNLITRKIVI